MNEAKFLVENLLTNRKNKIKTRHRRELNTFLHCSDFKNETGISFYYKKNPQLDRILRHD